MGNGFDTCTVGWGRLRIEQYHAHIELSRWGIKVLGQLESGKGKVNNFFIYFRVIFIKSHKNLLGFIIGPSYLGLGFVCFGPTPLNFEFSPS